MNDSPDFQLPDDPHTPAPITRPVTPAARKDRTTEPAAGRTIPFSDEAEQHVLACCLLDGADTLKRCDDLRVSTLSFHVPANRAIYQVMRRMQRDGKPIDIEVLHSELSAEGLLDSVGGLPYLMEVTRKIPTTAHAGYFLEKLTQLEGKREIIRKGTEMVEHAYNGTELPDLIADAKSFIDSMVAGEKPKFQLTAKPLMEFELPGALDTSTLVGDRWLSKGDGAIIASTSGMGKSSLTVQTATHWALGRDIFGGMKPARPLRSLIFQSEDSEGDIAEVRHSLIYAMKLTADEQKTVSENVKIVTDRVHRGPAFIAELKRQIAIHRPDVVWINPLLAFIGGDVNDAQEAGTFLREGLNSLNEPAQFAYIIVHHTSKPPKEKTDRKWNEVMYDMAGSADLTNWARAILSLRPADTEGRFNLVLAKRGRRAGFVKKVPGTVNPNISFYEPVSTIAIKHSTERFTPAGSVEMPVIHWELCDELPALQNEKSAGRPRAGSFNDFSAIFPKGIDKSVGFRPLWRTAGDIKPIGKSAFDTIIKDAIKVGQLQIDLRNPAQPKYYLALDAET